MHNVTGVDYSQKYGFGICREDRIFGRTLSEILNKYPRLDFVFSWLQKITKIPELLGDEHDLDKFARYIELKTKVNRNPNLALDSETEEFVYRLLHDFFVELKDPLPAAFKARITELIADLESSTSFFY